jgi:SAM-dependent methyltransferase
MEVGCGTGNLSVLIAQACRRLVAVDIDPDSIETARARLAGVAHAEVHCGDACAPEALDFGRFDSIVMLDVLEHIEDDAHLLADLARLLKPGGRLIIKVPAGQWLYGTLDSAVGHYRRYTMAGLRETLGRAGLVEREQKYFNRTGTAGWWWHGRLRRRHVPPAGSIKAFDGLVPVIRWAERLMPLPFGLSIISISERADPR